MPVNYVARKCDCGGKLEYDKARKVWVCLYCGSEIERTEDYGGLFTINNVVKQAILDIANHQFENAEKNILECKKIDSRYIGTVIAELCFIMAKLSAPIGETDMKTGFIQVRKLRDQLSEDFPAMGDEEENLYEFIDAPDAFGVLLLAFDALNDRARVDRLKAMIHVKDLLSRETCAKLFGYALKNGDDKLSEEILSESECLDERVAVQEVLFRQPDGDKKAENVRLLAMRGGFRAGDKGAVVKYTAESPDSASTKAEALAALLKNGVHVDVRLIAEHVFRNATDAESVKKVIDQLPQFDLADEEIDTLLLYVTEQKDPETAEAVFDYLTNSKEFVAVSKIHFAQLINNDGFDIDRKVGFLRTLFGFSFDRKTIGSVLDFYLNGNKDAPETRFLVMDEFLKHTAFIPPSVLQTYLNEVNADGDEKPRMLSKCLSAAEKAGAYHELLSAYLLSAKDPFALKQQILDVMFSHGLKVEPGAITDYLLRSNDDPETKIRIAEKAVANGAVIKSDAFTNYVLEKEPEEYDADILELLLSYAAAVSDAAAVKYVLRYAPPGDAKARGARMIAERNYSIFGCQQCRFGYNGMAIEANLLQAYLLITRDSLTVANGIVNAMLGAGADVNRDVTVDSQTMKWRKFLSGEKERLPETSAALISGNNLYGKLF